MRKTPKKFPVVKSTILTAQRASKDLIYIKNKNLYQHFSSHFRFYIGLYQLVRVSNMQSFCVK